MARPCGDIEIVPTCRVCELWAEYPEFYALYEGLPQPEIPPLILELRKAGPVLWRSPGLVKQMAENSKPGLFAKAVNFAWASAAHAATGFTPADGETRATRWELCLACPEKLEGDVCRKCGCGLALKISWASSQCPLGRW